jgi:hypothetical protein
MECGEWAAATVGFLAAGHHDHAYFFRDFKRRFGLAPSQYRKYQTTHLMAMDEQPESDSRIACRTVILVTFFA